MTSSRTIVSTSCTLVLLGGLVTPSCTVPPSEAECVAACSVAGRCGLLPSALGGAVDESRADNERDCIARCLASDAFRPQVAGLVARLGEAEVVQAEPLCSYEGMETCEHIIRDAEDDPTTSELEVTTDLTIYMDSAVGHVTRTSLSSWCCFDPRYELPNDMDMDDASGEDFDEITAVYDMFEPTLRCIEELRQHADAAIAGLACTTPDAGADDGCRRIQELWEPRSPELEPGTDDDPCRYARMSTHMRELAISTRAHACEPTGLEALRTELEETLVDWNLEPGGRIVDSSGSVRDEEALREILTASIRDELTRPNGLLQEACEELFEELGPGGCDALDRDAPPEQTPCLGGPMCSAAECLEHSPACDTSLCNAEHRAPGRDCGRFGITALRLGYRTAYGLESLSEPLVGCETLREVVTTLEDVQVGAVVPIAIVSGILPSSFIPHGARMVGDGRFSWIVKGEGRWVAAGHAQLKLPSPLLEFIENELDNPLELLGWVPRRLPKGQVCDMQPTQCEGYFNDNCDNGIDDDGDGLVDVGAWCDELYRELSNRCMVVEPLRGLPAHCLGAPS